MQRQTYRVTTLSDRHAFIKLSDQIALITQALKRPGKAGRRARVVSAYFGFATESEAIAFIAKLRGSFPKVFCQMRPAQRLTTAIEVKVRAFDGLEKFAWLLSQQAVITPQQAKASIQPPMVESIRPVQAIRPIELAPVARRSYRAQRVGGLAIE